MPRFLHVGCGPKRAAQTTPAFAQPHWDELRLDIDPEVRPDIVGSMVDMSAVPSVSVDAIYSSHNLEHLYPHEVPVALREFSRVLQPAGFAVVTCPDLQSVCALVAENRLTETLHPELGSITPLDMLYGYRPALAEGNLYMAHHCGFTERLLVMSLRLNGFASVRSLRRGYPYLDLWALATPQATDAARLEQLVQEHLPLPLVDDGNSRG